MELNIKCFATLASLAPVDGKLRDVVAGATVTTVMDMLKVPCEEVKIIFINGVHAQADTPLKDGDRVGLFPAVGGG